MSTTKEDVATKWPVTLMESNLSIPGVIRTYHGKVRDMYYLEKGLVVMVATDRLSAFDVVLPKGVPRKGEILTDMSWRAFQQLTGLAIPSWGLCRVDPQAIIGRVAEPLKVEVVVRGYLEGSAFRSYEKGNRLICGLPLQDGMKQADRLKDVLITPTTKAEAGHDEDLTHSQVLRRGLCTPQEWQTICRYALALFKRGSEVAAKRGLILVDTKYEFGRREGQIVLIDEIHTPDSSRYYLANGYEERQAAGEPQIQLSKEFARKELMELGFMGKEDQKPVLYALGPGFYEGVAGRYLELRERMLGEAIASVEEGDPNERISRKVTEYLRRAGL